jgi:hypothetical protein
MYVLLSPGPEVEVLSTGLKLNFSIPWLGTTGIPRKMNDLLDLLVVSKSWCTNQCFRRDNFWSLSLFHGSQYSYSVSKNTSVLQSILILGNKLHSVPCMLAAQAGMCCTVLILVSLYI